MPSKRPPGQLAAYTFGERDVVEYYQMTWKSWRADDLEKLAGPCMCSALPLPPSHTMKSFRWSGNAARGKLARQAAAALLYASGPACSAAHNLPSNRDGSPAGAAGRGGWGGGGRTV